MRRSGNTSIHRPFRLLKLEISRPRAYINRGILGAGSYMARTIEIDVNGTRHTLDAEPDRTLLTFLRDELDLTGTKYGCGEGQCGACKVLIDGAPARSCQ